MCTLFGSPSLCETEVGVGGEGSQQKRQEPSDISVKTGRPEFWPWILAAGTYASDSFCWPPERS